MIRQRKKLRICLTSSAGGHISQLLKIVRNWSEYETFCVTTTEVMQNNLRQHGKVYVVGECNRQHPIRVTKVLARCIRVVLIERPDVVISTGAGVGCIVCFLGKLLGAKVIWIDSITNVDKLSLSGRLVRHIADLFLVQWQQLAKKYRNVEYAGQVI